MNKAWTYIIDIFIGVLIMFVAVAIYFGLRTETVMKSMYDEITEEFVNSVKKNGVITIADYEGYMERMGTGNNLFDISFEHKYKILEPEYRFKTLEEIIEDQNNAYGGSNDYHYKDVITEKPHVDNPINDGNLNTDTNESVLSKAVDTPTDPSHVHTDDCYNGIKHIHTGNSSSGGGCYGNYQPHTHTDSCYETTYCSGVWHGEWKYNYYFQEPPTCASCGKNMPMSWSKNGPTLSYTCGSCGYKGTRSYSSREVINWYGTCTNCPAIIVSSIDQGGKTHGTIKSLKCNKTGEYKLTCGKTEGRYYDNNGNEVSPICGQTVVSIAPTHNNQAVYTNDSLITTARAVFKDGSERTVVCTTNFSTATPGVNKTATLTYSYTIDGTEHNKTCTVTVTVIPRSNTCPNGHIYNMNPDGSDPSCPYCREWIDSLRVIDPTTSPIVITIGTTLIQNNVRLLATYMDGHTEEVSSGYIDNLDILYLGTKPVIIGYKGATVSVMVTTICATLVCDICGYEYNLYPDGTNPGCPRCIQKIPVFTGNIMKYEYVDYTEEVLEELYQKGKYDFNIDDIFGLTVSNKSTNIARMLLRKIYPSLTERWFYADKKVHVLSK